MELPVFAGKLTMYRVCIMPMKAPEKTAGGVLMPDEAKDYNRHMNRVGVLIAKGPSCYHHPKFESLGLKPEDFPQIGDWVMYGQHQPMRVEQRGQEFVIMNDDEILAVIDDPEDFKAYVYSGNS
jgi:chaperonin GroES